MKPAPSGDSVGDRYRSKKTVTFNADSVENHHLAFSGFVVMEIGVRKKGMSDKSKWNCDRQI